MRRVLAAAAAMAVAGLLGAGIFPAVQSCASGESVEISKWSEAYTFDNVPGFYMKSFSTDPSRYELVPELSSDGVAMSRQNQEATGLPALVIYKSGSPVPDVNADDRVGGDGLETIADVTFTIKGNAVLTGTDGASYDFYYSVTKMSGFPTNCQAFTYFTLKENAFGQNRVNCVDMTVEFWVTEHGSSERIENLPWMYNNGVVSGEKWQLEWQEFCPSLIAYIMKTATYSADETGANTWLVGGKDKDMYSRLRCLSFEDKQTWKFWKRYSVDGKQVTTTNGAATGRQSMAVSFHLLAPTVKASYNSDEGGTITGKTSENRYLANQTTTGTEHQANDGYMFSHWVADQAIRLSDGTPVEAGEPLTDDQAADAFLIEDTTFTAVHDKKLNVRYESDEGGTITGIEEESVEDGGNPSGSESEPSDGYEFEAWTIDHDVTTTDDQKIEAGSPIDEDTVKKVIVTEYLVITAHHIPVPELAIDKKADKEMIDPSGDTVNYTIDLKNTADGSKAKNVVITDTGIPGMKIDMESIRVEGVEEYETEADEDGFRLSCGQILEGGDHIVITYSAGVADSSKLPDTYLIDGLLTQKDDAKAGEIEKTGRTFRNTAAADADHIDEPVRDTWDLSENAPELTIQKTVDIDSAEVGDTLNYTVSVTQTKAGMAATEVVVSDVLPENLVIDGSSVKCSDEHATVKSGSSGYTVVIPELTDTVTIRYKAQAVKAGENVKNTASVTSRQTPDPIADEAVVTIKETTAAGSAKRVIKSAGKPLRTVAKAVKTGDTKSWLFAAAAAAAVVIILSLFRKLINRI